MKEIKKILLIHGYNGAPEIFKTFKAELEAKGCEVAMPDFPVREDISVEGYAEVLDKYSDFITKDTAIIAHSIGNGMLIKYLFSHTRELGRFISLAGFASPFTVEGKNTLNEKVALINLSDEELSYAQGHIAEAFSIFSNDDHLVPYETLQKFPKLIGAEDILIENIGHMGHKSGITDIPGVANLISGNIDSETSCGCIIEHEDKILFEKQISKEDRFWGLPKGHIEAGETDIQAAIRETKEEVGLDVEITNETPLVNTYFVNHGKVLKRVLFFTAKPIGAVPAELSIQEDEVEEVRWVTLDEAINLADFEILKLTLKEYKMTKTTNTEQTSKKPRSKKTLIIACSITAILIALFIWRIVWVVNEVNDRCIPSCAMCADCGGSRSISIYELLFLW